MLLCLMKQKTKQNKRKEIYFESLSLSDFRSSVYVKPLWSEKSGTKTSPSDAEFKIPSALTSSSTTTRTRRSSVYQKGGQETTVSRRSSVYSRGSRSASAKSALVEVEESVTISVAGRKTQVKYPERKVSSVPKGKAKPPASAAQSRKRNISEAAKSESPEKPAAKRRRQQADKDTVEISSPKAQKSLSKKSDKQPVATSEVKKGNKAPSQLKSGKKDTKKSTPSPAKKVLKSPSPRKTRASSPLVASKTSRSKKASTEDVADKEENMDTNDDGIDVSSDRNRKTKGSISKGSTKSSATPTSASKSKTQLKEQSSSATPILAAESKRLLKEQSSSATPISAAKSKRLLKEQSSSATPILAAKSKRLLKEQSSSATPTSASKSQRLLKEQSSSASASASASASQRQLKKRSSSVTATSASKSKRQLMKKSSSASASKSKKQLKEQSSSGSKKMNGHKQLEQSVEDDGDLFVSSKAKSPSLSDRKARTPKRKIDVDTPKSKSRSSEGSTETRKKQSASRRTNGVEDDTIVGRGETIVTAVSEQRSKKKSPVKSKSSKKSLQTRSGGKVTQKSASGKDGNDLLDGSYLQIAEHGKEAGLPAPKKKRSPTKSVARSSEVSEVGESLKKAVKTTPQQSLKSTSSSKKSMVKRLRAARSTATPPSHKKHSEPVRSATLSQKSSKFSRNRPISSRKTQGIFNTDTPTFHSMRETGALKKLNQSTQFEDLSVGEHSLGRPSLTTGDRFSETPVVILQSLRNQAYSEKTFSQFVELRSGAGVEQFGTQAVEQTKGDETYRAGKYVVQRETSQKEKEEEKGEWEEGDINNSALSLADANASYSTSSYSSRCSIL